MANLQDVVTRLKEIAESIPSINTVTDENVYDVLNGDRELKYGVFVISQGTHRMLDNQMWFSFNLIYIDRLVDNLESNRLQVQSVGIEVLKNIINQYLEETGFDRTEVGFTTFTERFKELCAGAYANLSIVVPIDECYETYG